MQRMVAGLFVVLIGLGGALAFGSTPAGACDCGGTTDPAAFARADAVFVGEVTGYEATDAAHWTFAVRRIYKGLVAETQPIVSEISGAACGLEIPHQGEFLVFARYQTNIFSAEPTRQFLQASLCGGTRAVRDGALDPTLGRGRAVGARAPATPTTVPMAFDVVEDGSDGEVVPVVGAAVVFIAIVLGAVYRARARRSASDGMP